MPSAASLAWPHSHRTATIGVPAATIESRTRPTIAAIYHACTAGARRSTAATWRCCNLLLHCGATVLGHRMLAALTLIAAGVGAAPSTTIEVQAGKPLHQVRITLASRLPPALPLAPGRAAAGSAECCARPAAGEQDVHGLSQ